MTTRTEMTDAEMICTWMEPKPLESSNWWDGPDCQVLAERWPTKLTLDKLHDVENLLTPEQWPVYLAALSPSSDLMCMSTIQALVHSSPFVKIRALAAVLRERSGE